MRDTRRIAGQLKEKRKAKPGEVVAVLKRILSENGRDFVPYYVMAAACMVAVAATTAFSAWIMRDVVDELFYRQRHEMIAVICGAIFAAFAIRGLASYGQAVLLAKVGNNLVARYQRRLFSHLMKLGIGYFSDVRSGQLSARISENVAGVRDLLNMTLTSIARDLVTLIALIGVMIAQDPVLSISALVIGPPLGFAVNYLMRRLRSITRESVEVNARLIGAMQETVQGIAVVKAFTMEEQLSNRMETLIAQAENRSNKIARVSERLTPITELLAGAAIAGVIAYAGYRASFGNTPPGSVFAFITALLMAYDPARRLARVQVGIERALVNARMIYEVLDVEPHQRDVKGAIDLKVGKGNVAFEAIGFGYTPENPVLRDLSFVAPAGKTTAIVGSSGAGKSTVIALLERFYDLDSGRITIDGQDIATVTKRSLRGAIAYVSQQPYLFEGTIADNIRYGRENATDAEVREAARQAYAHDFIENQPHGYDTVVGENGVTLSGGQRQRLAIARAFLRNAPVLLLDEATSALDNESEAQVQNALATVMQGRTTIVIAHRLSTVVNADQIIVMEAGQVIERGTHGELMALNGIYARFQAMQTIRGSNLLGGAGGQAASEPGKA